MRSRSWVFLVSSLFDQCYMIITVPIYVLSFCLGQCYNDIWLYLMGIWKHVVLRQYNCYNPWHHVNIIQCSSIITQFSYPASFRYGLRQWEITLQCKIISHWLSPYQPWSPLSHIRHSIVHQWRWEKGWLLWIYVILYNVTCHKKHQLYKQNMVFRNRRFDKKYGYTIQYRRILAHVF